MSNLGQMIKEKWDNIMEDEILEYIDCMSERIAALNAANGGHKRW